MMSRKRRNHLDYGFLTEADIKKASTTELMSFYNECGNHEIKRFASRQAAEKQCSKLLHTLISELPEAVAEPVKHDRAQAHGVKASWADPQVHAARSARHHVVVKGALYRSLPSALKENGIDLSPSHIQGYRRDLVRNGAVVIDGMKFELASD